MTIHNQPDPDARRPQSRPDSEPAIRVCNGCGKLYNTDPGDDVRLCDQCYNEALWGDASDGKDKVQVMADKAAREEERERRGV